MIKIISSLILISLLPLPTSCEFTKLEAKECSEESAAFQLLNIDITPMPIVVPGKARLAFNGYLSRDFNGTLATQLEIVRTVGSLSPLRIKW